MACMDADCWKYGKEMPLVIHALSEDPHIRRYGSNTYSIALVESVSDPTAWICTIGTHIKCYSMCGNAV